MKPTLMLATFALLLSPLRASEATPESLADQIAQKDEIETLTVPEPNPLLFAGLGGLVILMCAVRRK